MRKLNNAGEMKKDGIYNLVYVGDNKAYAKINGKRTILVLRTEPKFEYVDLYDMFGDPDKDDIRSAVITVNQLSLAFAEDEIFEPSDESEWFKKSMKFTSLVDATESNVLTRDDITNHRQKFTSTFGRGVSTNFNVEDKTSYPYLQRIYVSWDSWEEMYADFDKFGIDARR